VLTGGGNPRVALTCQLIGKFSRSRLPVPPIGGKFRFVPFFAAGMRNAWTSSATLPGANAGNHDIVTVSAGAR